MSTIDMTQVAGLQAVGAEGQVIGTLSVDDLTELVSAKIIQESKNEAVSARSASVMSEASTIAATDEYEDQLEIDTNPAYVRSLDSDGNPKRTATTSLATVVGGLIEDATSGKRGLMSSYKAQYTNNLLRTNQSFTYYLKLARITYIDEGEAIDQHIEFALIGGNNYVGFPSLNVVGGFVHRAQKSFSKANLFGSDLLFGYIDDGTNCDIYVEVIGFNHHVRMILLSVGYRTVLTNEQVFEKPAGWINI